MKTIKERAKEYSKGQWDEPTALKAYIAGATEQKAIDIEKACEWMRIKKDWDEGCIEVFRIMMEE